MDIKSLVTRDVSEGAWDLAMRLLEEPMATLGRTAQIDREEILPLFGGREELLESALLELIEAGVPIQSGSETRRISVLEIASFSPGSPVLDYRFSMDFLRLIGVSAHD